MNNILKLNPYFSEKIWGYEKWNLSTHRNGCSKIDGSDKNLLEYLNEELPILIKIIKADESLSVQVHPGDEYARKYENDNGKTECWYILDAKEDAHLICGIKDGLNRETLSTIIKNGEIENYLERVSVKEGDMIYIPSGTVHAIEGGIKLMEVQQSSDVTYRMYDWGRDREMHIEKSLDVIDYERKNNAGKIENFEKLETPYFNVEKICVNGIYEDKAKEKFQACTCVKGSGKVIYGENEIELNLEETVYIPNGVEYKIQGELELLKAY